MTIAIPIHRALSTKLAPRGFNVVTRWGYNPWLARVNSTPNNDHGIETSQSYLRPKSRYFIATRSYATTAAAKPASRPKAHTGRTPAKRTTKASTSSKPGPKTAAGKRAVGRKPKAKATKTKTTGVAKKTAAKPRRPAVKKPPSASALLKERRSKEKELKEKALLNPPKKLPETAWTVIFSEAQKGSQSAAQRGQVAREAAQKFRNLAPEEKEHYNHVANQNKAANVSAERKWLSQFTPEQVLEANSARASMRRQYRAKHPEAKAVKKFPSIKDDRLVKKPRSSYLQFSKDRYASGDFAHMTIAETSKLVAREWKALDASEKKKYEDQGQADSARYIEEVTSVYGKQPKVAGKGPAKLD